MKLIVNEITYIIGIEDNIFWLILILISGWLILKITEIYKEYRNFENKVKQAIGEELTSYNLAKVNYTNKIEELNMLYSKKVNISKIRNIIDAINDDEVTFEFLKNKFLID